MQSSAGKYVTNSFVKTFILKKYIFPFWVSLKMPTFDTSPLLIPEKTSALISDYFIYLYIIIQFN